MPNITINKKDLLNLLGRKIEDSKLSDRISMLGTDLERIGKDEIEVEIFPNRPDMLSVEGFARALRSFIGIKKELKEYKANKGNYIAKIDKKILRIRPYAVAAVVKDIKIEEDLIKSLMQLQEKLHITHGRNRKKVSIGVYDLDKIKFPITYTAKPLNFKFKPLEMNSEMALSQILVKHPKGKEYAHLLNNFNEYPIWIDSNSQVLSMPPIINSEETKVTNKTKNLFIDATGTDKYAVEQALNIVVCGLADRNGKIYSVKIENKEYPNLKPTKMSLNKNYANKILGLNLNELQIKELLRKMGINYSNGNAFIPPYRIDILSEIDLVEDIAIAYGYENFKEEIPNISTIAEEDKLGKSKDKIANLLIGFGLLETNTYNLTNKENQNSKMNLKLSLLEIENAVNKEYSVFRAMMIPSLLEALQKNKHNSYPQKIFEIGTVFDKSEIDKLAVVLTPGNYTDIKQLLDSLFRCLNISHSIKYAEHNSFIPGRVAAIYINNKELGYIGEMHPEVLTNFDLENPVSCFELNLNELFSLI